MNPLALNLSLLFAGKTNREHPRRNNEALQNRQGKRAFIDEPITRDEYLPSYNDVKI